MQKKPKTKRENKLNGMNKEPMYIYVLVHGSAGEQAYGNIDIFGRQMCRQPVLWTEREKKKKNNNNIDSECRRWS